MDPRWFPLRVLRHGWPRVSDRFIQHTCPPRVPEQPVEQVHADLAAALQERTEQAMVHLARFAPEQETAMHEAMAKHADEPWYEDASAALAAEQAGDFSSDEELGELAVREFPFYFADFGDKERAYLDTLRDEAPNADTLLLFNKEIFESFDLRPQLGKITAPTLVVTGELDFITGPVCATEIAEEISNVKTEILPDSGHFIFVESPEAFRRAVLGFLA